jgi:putative membrane protein
MTYGQFLVFFLIPPLLLTAWLARHAINRVAVLQLAGVMALAVLYTTPWDSYIIARGVWSYDDDRVWGIFFWRIPLEEYLFYLLQVLITGLFTLRLLYLRRGRAG